MLNCLAYCSKFIEQGAGIENSLDSVWEPWVAASRGGAEGEKRLKRRRRKRRRKGEGGQGGGEDKRRTRRTKSTNSKPEICCQKNLNQAFWLTQCISNTYVMMVAFIHKIELRIEWIWQIGAESIWPKNHAFTDGTLHSRPNGRSYHLLRLSSWLVTSDWGGGLVSYDAGTQLRSSVHHRC